MFHHGTMAKGFKKRTGDHRFGCIGTGRPSSAEDIVEQLRKAERGKDIYAMRKETIERVSSDAKEKHAMRYTRHRGLARVTGWVRFKYAAISPVYIFQSGKIKNSTQIAISSCALFVLESNVYHVMALAPSRAAPA